MALAKKSNIIAQFIIVLIALKACAYFADSDSATQKLMPASVQKADETGDAETHTDIAKVVTSAVACPSVEALEAVYSYTGESGLEVINHYGCQMFAAGGAVQVIERGPIITTIVIHNVIAKDQWLYVRSIDLSKKRS